jgi:hypothetical protein
VIVQNLTSVVFPPFSTKDTPSVIHDAVGALFNEIAVVVSGVLRSECSTVILLLLR